MNEFQCYLHFTGKKLTVGVAQWLGQDHTDCKWWCQYTGLISSLGILTVKELGWQPLNLENIIERFTYSSSNFSEGTGLGDPCHFLITFISHRFIGLFVNVKDHTSFSWYIMTLSWHLSNSVCKGKTKKWDVFRALNISIRQGSCIQLFILFMLNFLSEKFYYRYLQKIKKLTTPPCQNTNKQKKHLTLSGPKHW